MASDCTPPRVPELSHHSYRRGGVDFAFVLNARDRNLRVYDFRVGSYPEKRDFFDRIAREQRLRKVFLIVEKRDSVSWRNVGFSREGSIPGYFRTVDALIVCRHYDDDGQPMSPPRLKPRRYDAPDLPARAEVRAVVVTDPDELDRARREHGPHSAYVPYSRDRQGPDLGVRARLGRDELWVTAETDAAYAHAKLDLLSPPGCAREAAVLGECTQRLCRVLAQRDLVTVYVPCRTGDELSNAVLEQQGFRTTARLANQLGGDGELHGINVWHRRLSDRPLPRYSGDEDD